MKKIIRAIHKSLSSGQNVVLCTISKADGSAPRVDGSQMLVYTTGETIGTVGGGKIEYLTIQKALKLLEEKHSDTERYILQGEENGGCGMICGGDVTIFFHFLDPADTDKRLVFQYAEQLLNQNEDIWLVTKMDKQEVLADIYCKTEQEAVSVTDKADDMRQVFRDGHWLLGQKFSRMTEADFRMYPYSKEDAYLIEPLTQQGKVYIFGSGHVAKALAPVLARVGFRTVILDELPLESMKPFFPEAYDVKECEFSDISKVVDIGVRDYVIIMTRGHMGDFEVLEQALRTPAEYVGMIGSRKKQAAIWGRLREDGFSQEMIDRIHNPIGLPILAETPEEIAVSIAGELILHRAAMQGCKRSRCMK